MVERLVALSDTASDGLLAGIATVAVIVIGTVIRLLFVARWMRKGEPTRRERRAHRRWSRDAS